MHPTVKAAIRSASERYGVPPDEIAGPKKRSHKRAVMARRDVIRELYDPKTSEDFRHSKFQFGLSEIGRQLGIDHTTVFYAVVRLGIHPSVRSAKQ